MKDAYYGITDDIAKNLDWISHQLEELGKHTGYRGLPLIDMMRSYVLTLRNKVTELKARGDELSN